MAVLARRQVFVQGRRDAHLLQVHTVFQVLAGRRVKRSLLRAPVNLLVQIYLLPNVQLPRPRVGARLQQHLTHRQVRVRRGGELRQALLDDRDVDADVAGAARVAHEDVREQTLVLVLAHLVELQPHGRPLRAQALHELRGLHGAALSRLQRRRIHAEQTHAAVVVLPDDERVPVVDVADRGLLHIGGERVEKAELRVHVRLLCGATRAATRGTHCTRGRLALKENEARTTGEKKRKKASKRTRRYVASKKELLLFFLLGLILPYRRRRRTEEGERSK
ncbi:micrococcal nuclease [Strigomonas culicis]|uniref:Micrococcal nuclease n=1 Tax=Strigomonas culicis TaxID=28005 RepID=S9UYC6_9TRYP|nr:micrococcal nuclease [Strigomonas culicis]|eukprot:EPY35862.1 micrococcal nuclease [Strigomonas culicis]